MILIKSIETVEVEGDMRQIYQDYGFQGSVPCYRNGAEPDLEDIAVIQELVRGQRFIRPDGQTVCIGQSKAVADLIGVQYEAWENMEKRLEDVQGKHFRTSCDLVKANTELKRINELGFWGRLKRVFKK